MKLFLIATLTILLASCGYMGNSALDYNNSLVKKQYEVSEDMNAFMDFIKISRMDSITDIDSYKTELNSLRDKALSFIMTQLSVSFIFKNKFSRASWMK